MLSSSSRSIRVNGDRCEPSNRHRGLRRSPLTSILQRQISISSTRRRERQRCAEKMSGTSQHQNVAAPRCPGVDRVDVGRVLLWLRRISVRIDNLQATGRTRRELRRNPLDRPPFFARPNEEDGRFEPRRTRAGGLPCPLHSSQQVRPRTKRGSCTRNSTAWTVCRDRGSCRPDRLCVMEAEQNRRIKRGTAPISRDGRASRPG
jgi:hypothetical protein